ncbi:MAG TPA: hypothetical protein VFY36_04705 [Solirubrobacteraceae bacterium]|nr:hypothetical protein [Solirubrobacteraceae bacterium]
MRSPLAADLGPLPLRSTPAGERPVIISEELELLAMQAHLLYTERNQPVVAIALYEETEETALWHAELRPILGPETQIRFVAEDLIGQLREGLGRKLALSPESARIWWPGLSSRSDPSDHPLVLTLDGERRTDVIAEIARQFDLSRPHVRRELRLIEDARALAEHRLAEIVEQDQRTAERLRDAHRERHREAARAQAAEARLEDALRRLAEYGEELKITRP